MRGNYIILYIYMILFILFNEINASGRTPKFVNVDEDGNLRGETTDVTKIFDEKKTLGSAFVYEFCANGLLFLSVKLILTRFFR